MKTEDRELLELAAKAVGLSGHKWFEGSNSFSNGANWGMCADLSPPWNPLTDDGDTFRLMVRLNLYGKHSVDDFLREENDSCGGDYLKATRRAITRAAAEIGRGLRDMPTAEQIRDEWT